ncbi:hypothetical protein MKK69_19850 [Methylobacterium sp. J-026]|uniref:hypothetical protein n=1 Tax=Methylobacterium sp. J-026 TaxID=2836624 RepID=UPI001FBBE967|nr:hypothetical protein [Methylobacterium sp. J-026]MCJ2136273.1 hypothetical protein [Methylobacterium sp. J-026]
MPVAALTLRRFLLLALLLVSLIKLADSIAHSELQRAAREMTYAAAVVGGEAAGASDE